MSGKDNSQGVSEVELPEDSLFQGFGGMLSLVTLNSRWKKEFAESSFVFPEGTYCTQGGGKDRSSYQCQK